ncbi:MAG TPA: hypothetical protein VF263_20480, partial [Longimicrobiaceae bacterium]
MKFEKIIADRFEQLLSQGRDVEGTSRRSDYGGDVIDAPSFHQWATSALSLLRRVFGEGSDHYMNLRKVYDAYNGYAYEFDKCWGIFRAAEDDFRGGYLFRVHALVSAEVLDDVLEQASELLEKKYKDPACVVAGVTLETTLKELCDRQGLPAGKLDKMNADLAGAGVYNKGMQKQITAWAHWRNKAAHGEWNEYSEAEVRSMITGITRF